MKSTYTGLVMHEVRIASEHGFLTSSIVEVASTSVEVESYKDGFADFGDNGFEVSFE